MAMDDLSDEEFRRTYRCTRASFEKLLKVLSKKIDLKLNYARKDTGGAIPLRVRLAMTLRFLAGASYSSSSPSFSFSSSSCSGVPSHCKSSRLVLSVESSVSPLFLSNFPRFLVREMLDEIDKAWGSVFPKSVCDVARMYDFSNVDTHFSEYFFYAAYLKEKY